jgi:hypothetical protein
MDARISPTVLANKCIAALANSLSISSPYSYIKQYTNYSYLLKYVLLPVLIMPIRADILDTVPLSERSAHVRTN